MTEVNDEIIELMKNNSKIAHHLHIPVQSCCDSVLKNMHRPYTIEKFKERINYIRKQIPDISISTDLIVGFPNESDEDFETIKNELKEIEFSFIHVFPYSRKSGTVADSMEGHIDPRIKKARVNDVIALERNITKKFKNSFIGKDVDVLIEKFDNNYSYGYSKQYFYCKLEGQYPIGDIIKVKVKEDTIYEA